MPILRLNSRNDGIVIHGSPEPAMCALRNAASGSGPVIIMTHGFKYDPDDARHSPHSTIFALHPRPDRTEEVLWPRHLGFGTGQADEGLAIAFGWGARGNLWKALKRSRHAGQHLAEIIGEIRRLAPERDIHIITHSMGSEVAFEALEQLPARSVKRLVALTAASYRSRAEAALRGAAGQTVEFFNVTSRENDLFDFLFERLIEPPKRRDRALGQGLAAPNAVTIQIDSDQALSALLDLGVRIAPPKRRVCHWSGYLRPGAMPFYARLMRSPETMRLKVLQDAMQGLGARRWSRLTLVAQNSRPLPGIQKAAS